MKCPKCHHEFSLEDHFFRECYDYITNKFPHLIPANMMLIHQWKETGYSFEKHIKPVIDSVHKDKKVTMGYFNAILNNNRNEVKPLDKREEISLDRQKEIREWKNKMGIK